MAMMPDEGKRDAHCPDLYAALHPELSMALAEESLAAMALLDGQTLGLKWANRRFRELLRERSGWEELAGRSVEAWLSGDAAERLASLARAVAAEGRAREEAEFPWPGTSTWWHLTLQPVAVPGRAPDVLVQLTDVTQAKRARESLGRLDWLLQLRSEDDPSPPQPYGDLAALNRTRVVADAVGEDVLHDVVRDYLDLLDTSSTVFEKTGEYALGLFTSSWCRFVDQASRELCQTDDNREALASGRWHCREACWEASRRSIETRAPVDMECLGGIRLYALPIIAGEEVVGSINFGYGDPPRDPEKLQELAEQYQVSAEELAKRAEDYQSRPLAVIEAAKRRLATIAQLIGEIVWRKRVERELQASNAHLQSVLDSITDAYFALDSQWRFVEVNRVAAERIFHRPAESLLGKVFWEEYPLGAETDFYKHSQAALAEGRPVQFETELDQVNEWYEIHVYPGTERLEVYLRDITDRKRAEQQIRMVSQFPEQNPSPVLRIARDGTLTYANAASAPLLAAWGTERGQAVPDDWKAYVAAAFDSRRVEEIEIVVAGRTFSCILAPIADEGYVNVYVRDITERKEMVEALRASEQRFRQLAESLPQLVWTCQPDGPCDYLSRQWVEYTGAPEAAHLGYGWLEQIHPDDREPLLAAWQEALRAGVLLDVEVRVRGADGVYRWFKMRATPIKDAEGRIVKWFGSSTDVDELKRTQQQLKTFNETLERRVAERTAQLRALTAELTQTEQRERRRLAQLLHDHLQQLLVAARLKVGILRRRVGEEIVQQALGQIDELLDQSISSSRSLTVELSPPVLYDGGLVPALEWLVRQMEEKHGLKVQLEADPEATPAAEDTRILLFQVVRELLFNVVKHAQVDQARLAVRRRDDDRLEIIVADDGTGFDPAGLEQEKVSGGFGLFSVRERLAWIGGQLRVESRPGGGTRIVLLVPSGQPHLTPEPEAPALAAVEEPPAHVEERMTRTPREPRSHAVRVLLADDHPILRQGLANLLGEQPAVEVVGEAADGQQAVELAHRTQPDVVLMDVTMPRLNGIEATRRLRVELPQVRVIGLSMHEGAEMAAAMREAGAVAYLSKDISSEALLEAILAHSPTPSSPEHGPLTRKASLR